MGITGTEIAIPTMTVKVAAITVEQTASVPAEWGSLTADARWEPVRIRMGANGELSTLTLRRVLGALGATSAVDAEDEGTLHGKKVQLLDGDSAEWFAGYTGQDAMLIQGDPQAEDVQVTVYGPELRLQQKVVSGQWHINEDIEDKIFDGSLADADFVRANIHTSDIKCVFNPMGIDKDGNHRPIGNMYDSDYTWNLATGGSSADADRGCSVFDSPGRSVMESGQSTATIAAEIWLAKRALRAIVEYFDDGDTLLISAAEWDAIEATLGTATIGEVPVDGMNLLQAMRAILLPIGFGFSVDVASQDGAGSFLHRLHVEDLRKAGTTIELVLGQKGFGVSSTYGASEVKRLDFMRDGHNIRNEVTVIGSPVRVQVELNFQATVATRDLHPAWATANHDLADYATDNVVDFANDTKDWATFGTRYRRSGDEYPEYRHVFRSFVWNEDGAFSEFVKTGPGYPLIPDLPALYGIGTGYNCLRRPRPVKSTIVWADSNKNAYQPARVILGVPVGSFIYEVDISAFCTIWKDRAGFTVNGGGGAQSNDLFGVDEKGEFGDPWFPFALSIDTGTPDALRETSYLTLLHNTIRIGGTYQMILYLQGSIEDDNHVQATVTKQASRAMPLLSQQVVRRPEFVKVREGDGLPGTEDTRDDTALCTAAATLLRNTGEDELGMGSIMVPFVTRTLDSQTLRPLLGVTGTTGRIIDFDVDGGADVNFPLIRQVVVTFGDAQVTELTLDSNLLGIS